jgi:hypothetical protein
MAGLNDRSAAQAASSNGPSILGLTPKRVQKRGHQRIAEVRAPGRNETAVEPGWNEFPTLFIEYCERNVRQSDKNSDVLRAAA